MLSNFSYRTSRWMPRLAFRHDQVASGGDTLVVIFLRGAADVLNIVVPHGEQTYYDLRPSLGIPHPDDRHIDKNERVVDLDGFFGFHPAMHPLLDAWQEKQLAIIHACGAPDESRSHFKAMELMERGVDDERGPASGWIGRHLASFAMDSTSPLRAIGVGEMPPRSLSGAIPVSTLRSIADFHLGGDERALAWIQTVLAKMYENGNILDVIGQETLQIMETLQALDLVAYRPKNTTYPETEFGLALKQVAMLVKAEVGLEVAAIDLGGWDTHFAQGGSTGFMANLIEELSGGLAAFHADMVDHWKRLTLVTMSEFGRRIAENGSLGTDHGHGSMMMVLSGHARGGKVHGMWPGLGQQQLVGPGDLAVKTDYRDVLAEVILNRLNNSAIDEIFPGYQPQFPGVLV